MNKLVLLLLLSMAASACAGGSSSGSTALTARSTGTSRRPLHARPVRLVLGFGDEVGLRARFPLAWYAQPYASSNLLITSFPVHVDDGRVWEAIPAGGTAIQIYDEPSGSSAECRRLAGPHAHLRLGRYEPNYEGIGPAFRSQFHDHGHTVLVFTSFGGTPPTQAQRALAERILNTIQVEYGACPVRDILALGQRATVLNRLLTHAAAGRVAAIRSRRGAYTPKLSATSGSVGTRVTITGAIPSSGEHGQPVRLARLVVWWNLNTGYPSPSVTGRTPARRGRLVKLTTIPLATGRSHYRSTFTVPNANHGRYPIVVLQEAKDGSIAQLGAASLKVTATP